MTATPTEINDMTYPLLPLRDVVVYPHMVVPLFVGREKSITALEDAMENDKQVVLLAQRNPADDNPELIAALICGIGGVLVEPVSKARWPCLAGRISGEPAAAPANSGHETTRRPGPPNDTENQCGTERSARLSQHGPCA
jgi:hypothetical protein